MPKANANDIQIEYETFGQPQHPPLVLIQGITSQLVSWPIEFCRLLAGMQYYVIRFDNRDTGLSTKMEGAEPPDFARIHLSLTTGQPVDVPYSISDMAADTVGLMDALGIEKAHVCGVSMGGMIAQTIAIEYPRRLLSLMSFQATTGALDLPPSRPGVWEALMKPAPRDRKSFVTYFVELNRLFASGSKYYDAAVQAAISAISYDRCLYPEGVPRQYAAIMTSGDRREDLAAITVPTLVLHGDVDALLPMEHGLDTADAIAGAKLIIINGLGHGTAYPRLWDEIAAVMDAHMREVDGR